MSTKATLYLDRGFHLFREALDDENVYLEIESASEFLENLVIKIPVKTWNEMVRHRVRIPENRD
jgi:hypothetical protein